MNNIGNNDNCVEKAQDDMLGVKEYAIGLAEFIKACVTPMTISIQGDWGSGKTSMMNLIKIHLGNDVMTVWFNTWQYSQFEMGNALTLSLLGRLIKELHIDDSATNDKIKDTAATIFKIVKSGAGIALDHFVGGKAAEVLDEVAAKFSGGSDDGADAIGELKVQFKIAVEQKLKAEKKERLVIFIDDLDRLKPGKAVELLEVLKIFLDCEKCVFVLAIDYSVVSQGVREKYGDLIGEDKGKSFFDKIIQVPFKMPVAHYQVKDFIEDMLKKSGIEPSEGCDDYVDLIQYSVGCNPRTMKRLFNAYLLLDMISAHTQQTQQKDAWQQKMLFGILCCQHAFEQLYNFIVRNLEEISDNEVLSALGDPDTYSYQAQEDKPVPPIYQDLAQEFAKTDADSIRSMATFMKVFYKALDKDGSGSLGDDELKGFQSLLQVTTITSANSQEPVQTRYKQVVVGDDVEDFDFSGTSREDKVDIFNYLRKMENTDIKLLVNKSGILHIVGRIGGKRFCDLYAAKQFYSVECFFPDQDYRTNSKYAPRIDEMLNQTELGVKPSDWSVRSVYIPARSVRKLDPMREDSIVKELLWLCWDTWNDSMM